MPNACERFSLAGVRHIHAHNRFPSRHPGCLMSSLLLFSCHKVDDFLGTGFLREASRTLEGT